MDGNMYGHAIEKGGVEEKAKCYVIVTLASPKESVIFFCDQQYGFHRPPTDKESKLM